MLATANLKYRVKGDKPSVTRAINSANPQTFSGKLFKKTAQAVNFAAHDVSQTAVDVALATETIGLESAKNAQHEVQNKLKQKYTREAVDDYHKGTLFVIRTSADAVKGTRKHFKQKKQHRLEKAKFKLQKAENRLVKEQNKPKFKANKSDLKSAKSEFKKHKKNFKNGSRSNVLKARQIRRKQAFHQTKKEIQFKQKEIKKDEKFRSKKLVNQRNISAFTAENLLALKPVDYGGKKMKASAWQKAVNEDSDNDFMHAVDSAKRRIAENLSISLDTFTSKNLTKRQLTFRHRTSAA